MNDSPKRDENVFLLNKYLSKSPLAMPMDAKSVKSKEDLILNFISPNEINSLTASKVNKIFS